MILTDKKTDSPSIVYLVGRSQKMGIPFKLRLLLLYDRMVDRVDLSTLTPKESRQQMEDGIKKVRSYIQYPDEELHEIREVLIPVFGGDRITLRIYRPDSKFNLPLIVYFHGGGWVQGSLETHENSCRRLAKQNNAVVVSVDYRLAPEYPFPVPGGDCYTATVWAVEHAGSFGANPAQLIVMGDSAGGNMAAIVSLMARDKNGPQISLQVLIYPALDATLSMPSVHKLGKGYLLTEAKMQWYRDHYCGIEPDKKQPYLSPVFASDLTNLPPALIITAEFDPLKDDGEVYAKRLKESGNEVVFKEYKGMIHAFLAMPKLLRSAREAEAQITAVFSQTLLSQHHR
jgi:acetyl esterase